MRKLYSLLTGLFLTLLALTAKALPTPDVAGFTFTIDVPNNNVNFVNTSVLGSEPGIRKAYWSFGDGIIAQTGPLQGIQHHYNAAGTYNVCLRIYRFLTNGNDSVLSAQICQTLVINPACGANFEFRDSLLLNTNPLQHLVKFWALPFHNAQKPVTRVCWNFGDGSPDTCITNTAGTPTTNLLNITHTYLQQGPYNVCVRITYQDGCVAEKCKPVTLLNPPPPPPADSCTAAFERIGLTPTSNPLQATFRALPWHNNNKLPVRICWNFGDGRDTCIQYTNTFPGPYTVNHTYPAPGVYNVCVSILYQGGCQSYRCNQVLIGRPDSCGADYERLPLNTSPNPLSVLLKALPQHNNNKKPQRICWNFGDGRDTCIEYLNVYTGLYTVAHTYQQPGNYNVCVTIRYFGGCEAVRCKPLVVSRPDTCGADFVKLAVTPANNPLFAYFQALPSHNNNRKPSRICWTFGDGRDTCINYTEAFTGMYGAGHQYQQPGNYQVCVTITYFGGCTATRCKPIQVQVPDSCRAGFELMPATSATPLTIGLRALPWHSNNKKPVRICWNFGDGTPDTCINYPVTYTGAYTIVHHYQQPGAYNVCVNIRYDGGCEAHFCRSVQVPPPPPVTCTAGILEITPSINSLTRSFVAVPGSNPPVRPERVCWIFGDGRDTCIMLDPTQPTPNLTITHTYPGPGTYHACVEIRYQGGCLARSCREVVIRSNTGICGGYMTDSIVGPRTFRFRGFSIHGPNDNPINFRWTFGDGTSANGPDVTHTFTQAGPFNVCLVINTQSGCETRVCRPISVPGTNNGILAVSPNPVANTLNALFHSAYSETVTIRILNSSGNPVRIYTRNAVTGPNTWTFDVSTLLPGIYSLVVQSPNQLASVVFIKQ